MFGTVAACAGPQRRVRISSPSEISSNPPRLSTNGRSTRRLARPMSHSTITLRRSKRSMMTPPTVPRRKPGSTRVVMTRLTAAPELSDTRAAMARIAIRPIQSPRLETTCAVQSRKKVLLPKTRHGASGIGGSDASEGMNGASRSRLLVGHPRLRPGSGARSGRRGRLPRRPLGGRLLCRRLLRRRLLRGPDFFAGAFLAVDFFVAFFVVGPRAARSASRSTASVIVTASGWMPRGTVALVVPSVMYGPKRPSSTRTGAPLSGCGPRSAIGGFATRPRRCLG